MCFFLSPARTWEVSKFDANQKIWQTQLFLLFFQPKRSVLAGASLTAPAKKQKSKKKKVCHIRQWAPHPHLIKVSIVPTQNFPPITQQSHFHSWLRVQNLKLPSQSHFSLMNQGALKSKQFSLVNMLIKHQLSSLHNWGESITQNEILNYTNHFIMIMISHAVFYWLSCSINKI